MENRNNTISASVSMVNGGYKKILDSENAFKAIEQYLYPDCRPTVSVYTLTATDNNGRSVTISISNGIVSISDGF
jgi:hypothetical protein